MLSAGSDPAGYTVTNLTIRTFGNGSSWSGTKTFWLRFYSVTDGVATLIQGYTNSGVAITLQLASTVRVTYTESGSFSTDLSRFRGTTDGYMDSIHTTRNSTAADVGVLIINNSSSCGLASGIGSSASTA